jgi:hypothetical protein
LLSKSSFVATAARIESSPHVVVKNWISVCISSNEPAAVMSYATRMQSLLLYSDCVGLRIEGVRGDYVHPCAQARPAATETVASAASGSVQ